MPSDDSASGYIIWGVDHAVYGPVELPTLVGWIKDDRVTSETWLFVERSGCWEKAEHVPELQMFFHSRHASPTDSFEDPAGGSSLDALSPRALRHVKVLACLNDEQLERFIKIMEVQHVPQGTLLARQGEPGNAMYLVLEGELRAHTMVDGHEIAVGTLNGGDFFGEISLFDQGPRSAEVIAARDTTVLKICASDFEKFAYETPDLAAPFLLAIAKTFTCRMRIDNKRYHDSISFSHPGGR
ncbi:MAG: transcriptional regulator, Crp/Fnr family [Pedosphaera sp.]|nr:transcriptional regulator, Crp/Fnr family [Pedosphaera sp.]